MSDIIKIPADIHAMRVKHLPFLLELRQFSKDEEPSIGTICRMNALFTGIPLAKMKRYGVKDNRALFIAICKAYGGYEQKEIPLTVTYPNPDFNKKKEESPTNKKEITYEFVSDFSKLPVDWFIDIDEIDFEEEPIDMCAFCFIEQGLSYGEPDDHDNVINPRSARREIFAEHMPLSTFLDVQTFFLLSWNVLQKLSTEAKSQKREKRKTK